MREPDANPADDLTRQEIENAEDISDEENAENVAEEDPTPAEQQEEPEEQPGEPEEPETEEEPEEEPDEPEEPEEEPDESEQPDELEEPESEELEPEAPEQPGEPEEPKKSEQPETKPAEKPEPPAPQGGKPAPSDNAGATDVSDLPALPDAPEGEQPAAKPTKKREKPLRRALRITKGVLYGILIAFLAFLAAVSISASRNGGTPRFLGVSLFTVDAGSMEPTIPRGSLIFTSVVPAEDIKPNDTITFFTAATPSDPGPFGGMVEQVQTSGWITHRVVEVIHTNNLYSYVTKGDANVDNDPDEVPYPNVHGVVFLSLPLLGYLIGFLRPPGYGFLLVVIPAVLILFIEIQRLVRLGRESRSKKKKGKREL